MGAPSRPVSRRQHGPPQDCLRSQPWFVWQKIAREVCGSFRSSVIGMLTHRSSSQRTLLLFVIRDHIGTTPLANLQATLTADLQRIWDSLSKPSDLQECKLSDYFDLSFTALPHKILATEKFEDD